MPKFDAPFYPVEYVIQISMSCDRSLKKSRIYRQMTICVYLDFTAFIVQCDFYSIDSTSPEMNGVKLYVSSHYGKANFSRILCDCSKLIAEFKDCVCVLGRFDSNIFIAILNPDSVTFFTFSCNRTSYFIFFT